MGYIAERSGHSRGSTVDLTIVNNKTNKELDMGTRYDFFGPESSTNFSNITDKQRSNRVLLLEVMTENGFKNYPKEWWHYTLELEPFNHYFNSKYNCPHFRINLSWCSSKKFIFIYFRKQ